MSGKKLENIQLSGVKISPPKIVREWKTGLNYFIVDFKRVLKNNNSKQNMPTYHQGNPS